MRSRLRRISIVKQRLILLAVILLGVVALWKGPQAWAGRDGTPASGRKAGDPPAHGAAADDGGVSPLPGKASVRFATDPAATHPPERLNQFYLPQVSIDGLPLEAALKQLQAAYEDACRETGETPLALTFSVPRGQDRLLTVKIGGGTFDNSIRLLASLSSLKVKREGSAYVFEAPAETGKLVKKSLLVPPDILSRLKSAASSPSAANVDVAGAVAALGIELDPSTRLKFSPGSSTLQIETTRAADEVAVSSMVERLLGERPVQHKVDTKILELGKDVEWTPPDNAQLDEAGMQLLMRELATKGVDLMTAPSTVARDGQAAKVEIVREYIFPVPGSENEFNSEDVGVKLDVTPVVLGFGQKLEVGFNVTDVEMDPTSNEFKIVNRASIADNSFSRDSSTRLHVETRPDGSRVLLLVTSTLVDATGRPVRPAE